MLTMNTMTKSISFFLLLLSSTSCSFGDSFSRVRTRPTTSKIKKGNRLSLHREPSMVRLGIQWDL